MSTQTRMLSQIQGVTVTAPTQNAFTSTGFEAFANDAAFVTAHGAPSAGQVYWNTTEKCLREYNGSAWQYDKSTYLVVTDSTTTGSAQAITPTAAGAAQIIRFTQGALASINNIDPTLQKLVYLVNDQASQAITITNDSGGTAANRIQTGNGLDFALKTGQIIGLIYDNINSRWRIISRPITGIEAFASDAAFVTAHGTAVIGDRYWNTTSLIVREHDGTSWENRKILLSVLADSSTTGVGADITPGYDQIIKFTNASLTSIRSINPALQKYLILINGTGVAVTFKNQDTGATAANRIITGTQNDIVLANDGSLLLSYDTNSSRWRVVGGTGTGSSSTASVNYFTDPTCENTAVGTQPTQAVQYNDGAVAIPVDGTGGAAVAQVTLLASQSSPLRGTQSFILAKDANNRQGVGYGFAFTVPIVDKSLTALWSFEYQTDTNFVSGDAGIWLYDVTNGALITPRLSLISKADGGAKIRSDYVLTQGTSYRWIIHIVSTNALAWNLKIDTMINTTDPGYATGAAIGLRTAYTPGNQGFGTPSAYDCYATQHPNLLHLEIRFLTGTVTAVEARVNLPTGYVVGGISSARTCGYYNRNSSTASVIKTSPVVATPGLSYVTFSFGDTAQAAAPLTNQNGSAIAGNSETFVVECWVPIVDSGSIFAPSMQPEYASNSSVTAANDTTSFANGSTGSLIPSIAGTAVGGTYSKRIQFQYAIQADDIIILEVNGDGGASQWEEVGASRDYQFRVIQNNGTAVQYGMSWTYVSGQPNQIDVTFGRGGATHSGNGYASAGQSWPVSPSDRYRVRKVRAASQAGVSLVSDSFPGFQRSYSSLSKIRLNTGNGYGSTNTAIRRFTNAVSNSGIGITYADSATLGASFTCVEQGVYAFSYDDGFNGSANFGLSLNSSQLTTAINSITAADRLVMATTPSAAIFGTTGICLALSVGDVVRPHADATAESAAPARAHFTVQRVS